MITPLETRIVPRDQVQNPTLSGRWQVASVQPARRKMKGKVKLVRLYNPYDELLPASQTAQSFPDYTNQVLGRERTSYFYKKMALSFLRGAMEFKRCGEYFPNQYSTFKSIALMYLKTFKKMKGVSA